MGKTRGVVVPSRPFSFLDLIHRFAPPEPKATSHRPLVGRIAEVNQTRTSSPPSCWAILHGVSASGAFLIHARPISASMVVFELDVPEKMKLSATFHVDESRPTGELFETAVSFVPEHAPTFDADAAASAQGSTARGGRRDA